MEIKAAVAYQAGKPLEIETVQLGGPPTCDCREAGGRATPGAVAEDANLR